MIFVLGSISGKSRLQLDSQTGYIRCGPTNKGLQMTPLSLRTFERNEEICTIQLKRGPSLSALSSGLKTW